MQALKTSLFLTNLLMNLKLFVSLADNKINQLPTGSSTLLINQQPNNNHNNNHNYQSGQRGKRNYPQSSNSFSAAKFLNEMNSLLPNNSLSYTSPSASATFFQTVPSQNSNSNYQNEIWSVNLNRDVARRKKRLQNNASSPVVNSRFIRPQSKSYYRPLVHRTFDPSTEVKPPVTENPNDILTSTSMSTSVSMSYTTVSDSSKVTTILNSDHFLLSRRKFGKNNSPSKKQKEEYKKFTRTLVPPEYITRNNKSKNNKYSNSH